MGGPLMQNADVVFRHLWTDLNLYGIPTQTFKWIEQQYSESNQRYYHTLEHIEEGLAAIEQLSFSCGLSYTTKLAVQFAFWFHDSGRNEQHSADIANFVLWTGRRSDLCSRVQELIKMTAHDVPLDGYVSSTIILDADLSILASAPVRFDRYEADIRKEYDWVSEEVFRTERRKILQRFLDRATIYYTDHGKREWEDKARANLHRSVLALQ